MHLRSFVSGVVVGAVLGVGAMVLFGDRVRGEMASTTRKVGQTVEKAGETLKEQGDKLR
ncbi:MAG: hypothetical protein HY903_09065 [Deltaproteobacteria bacterium]|nr:hypothetical protein [Deltaproteobacteria bacterium]